VRVNCVRAASMHLCNVFFFTYYVMMIGELVAELKERNLYDNTLIVLSADNGGPVSP